MPCCWSKLHTTNLASLIGIVPHFPRFNLNTYFVIMDLCPSRGLINFYFSFLMNELNLACMATCHWGKFLASLYLLDSMASVTLANLNRQCRWFLYLVEHFIVGNGVCCGILVLSCVSSSGFCSVFSIGGPIDFSSGRVCVMSLYRVSDSCLLIKKLMS